MPERSGVTEVQFRHELPLRYEYLGDTQNNARVSVPVVFGMITIVVTIGVLTIWSYLAPLASAVIASGTVVVSSDRKVVQHSDGGIVREILVEDGSEVVAGQTLVLLEDDKYRQSAEEFRSLLAINLAKTGRLLSERERLDGVRFPAEEEGVRLADFPAIQLDQILAFKARRASLDGRVALLRSEVTEASMVLWGLHQQEKAQLSRMELTQQDLVGARDLAMNGFGTRSRLRDIERGLAGMQSEMAALGEKIAESQGKIAHSTLEISSLKAAFFEQIEREIDEVKREHAELTQRLRIVNEQILRTRVRAPCSGIAVNLAIHTIGGSVMAGMPLVEIVPTSDPLLIEVHLRPSDVENVHPGLPVELRFGGQISKRFWRAEGHVVAVSADQIIDKARQTPYFLVRVRLDEEFTHTTVYNVNAVRPGMFVDVMIMTGFTTVLQYLGTPLIEFFAHGMRD